MKPRTVTTSSHAKKKVGLWPDFKFLPVCAYAVVAFLMLLPYIVIFYPGIVEIDTIFQIAEHLGYGDGFHGEGSWTSLFPVFCARFYGGLFQLGCQFGGGDQNCGIFAITLFQTVSMSFALSALACYLRKWNVPGAVCLVVLLASLAIPVLPHQVVNLGKDGLFTIFFVAYLICFLELIRTKGACITRHAGWLICLALFAAGLSLARSTGIYLVGLSAVFALLFTCRSLLGLVFQLIPVGAALAAVLLMSLYTSSLNAETLNYQEILGTPMQQTAQYLRESADISDEEYEALDNFYDVEAALAKFEPHMTDNVKIRHNRQAGLSELLAFADVYFKLGLRHPGTYWRAWYALYSGYIEVGTFDSLATVRFLPAVPIDELGIRFTDGTDFPDDLDKMLSFILDDKVIYAHIKLPEFAEAHPEFGTWEMNPDTKQTRKDFFSMLFGWGKLPVLNLLVSKGLYVTYLPLLMVVLAFASSHRKKLIPAMVPLVCIVLFAFVSPVDFTRYALPLIAVDFAVLALILANLRKAPDKGC